MRWISLLLPILAPLAFAAAPTANSAISVDLQLLLGSGVGTTISADHQGNLILSGQAHDCSLPVVHPLSTCVWLWLAKLDPTGQTILFATYFGDPKAQASVVSIQADPAGNLTILSSLTQTDLPAVNAIQSQAKGNYDLHIFKLAADGSRVIYATYLGGRGFDLPKALALDAQGAAYILLESGNSPDFPTTSQSLTSTAADNWVVAKLSPDGQSLQYAAAFPRVLFESLFNLQVDAAGAAWIVGGSDMLRLTPDGSALQRRSLPSWAVGRYPTLIPAVEGGYWLAGSEQNQALPTTPDAYQPASAPSPYLRIENGQIKPFTTPMPAKHIVQFAVDPFEIFRVYAATDAGLFKTEDNGWIWDPPLFTQPCDSIAIDPADQNALYVTSGGGLYRSTDRGQNWTRLSSGVRGIALDSHVPGLLYSSSGRSEDGGVTWQPFLIPQPVNGPCDSGCLFTTAVGVMPDPVQARRVYVFTETRCTGLCFVIPGLLRSDDAGRTLAGVPTAGVTGSSVAVDPLTQDLYIVSGGAVDVFRKSNLSIPEVLSVPEAQSIAIDPANGTVYLALTNSTIIQSADGARTWTAFITVPGPPPLITVSAAGVLHITQPATFTDSYAFHFDSSGQVVYGTAFGGWNTSAGVAAIGSNGHVFLGGITGGGMPLSNAWQSNFGGRTDGFVAEFDATGALLNSTYLGGLLNDTVTSLIPQDDGSVIVLGYSSSKEFLSQLQPSALGAGDYFVLRFHPNP